MVVNIILLLTLSIVTARLLERNYKVASIAHSVLFYFLLLAVVFTSDIKIFVDTWKYFLNDEFYETFKSALKTPMLFLNGSLSAIMVIEASILFILPLFSLMAFINKLKDEYKRIESLNKVDTSLLGYNLNNNIKQNKEFIPINNSIYLINGVLLN